MGGKLLRVSRLQPPGPISLVVGCSLVFYWLFFVSRSNVGEDGNITSSFGSPAGKHLTADLLANLSLTEGECAAAFPRLYDPIDDEVARGPFAVRKLDDMGPLQGKLKDGKLYIVTAQRKSDLSAEMLNSRTAALHQLDRAMITSPEPLPDTIFNLNFQDQPYGTSWAYSRAADPMHRPKDADARSFLMPHFSFWAWPLPFVGSIQRATAAIADLEAEYPGDGWNRKIGRAVWRGTTWFNSIHNPRLRQDLILATKGKAWADVEALQWEGGTKNAANAIPIEDFCRYKYVIHTEGIAYSGRFQFLQMCASVVLTPPIQWMQHTTHLVKPLFSSSLDLSKVKSKSDGAKAAGSGSAAGHGRGSGSEDSWVPSKRTQKVWPVQYKPEQANIVFVAPDWSDLEKTIAWLEDNPKIAQGIARRQRELFVDGGYFSPAAETCYWRALIRGWAKVAKTESQGWEASEDIPFETFSLSNGN